MELCLFLLHLLSPQTQRGVWSFQQLLLGSRHLAHLPLCCLLSSCLFFLGFRPGFPDLHRHRSEQTQPFASLAALIQWQNPRENICNPGLCHKSPEALEGLWFLSFSSLLPLRVSHPSCSPTCTGASGSSSTSWLCSLLVPVLAEGCRERSWLPKAGFWLDGHCPSHLWLLAIAGARGRSEPQIPAQPRWVDRKQPWLKSWKLVLGLLSVWKCPTFGKC